MGNCCCKAETTDEQRPLLVDGNSGTREYAGTGTRDINHVSDDIQDPNRLSVSRSSTKESSRTHSLQNSHEHEHPDPDQQVQNKTQELQKKLKYIYNKTILPHVSWLKKGEELTIKEYFVPFQLTSSGFNVVLQDLFRTDSKKILLEGHQGYGKSTTCYKLLNDWAADKSYISMFKLVFILPIRNLNDIQAKDIVEALAKIYSVDNQDEFRAVIEYHLEDTLFILDGLDEVPEDVELVKDILSIDRISTVLVTCRTGFIKSNRNPIELLDKKSYEKYFEINGIASEKRKQFLENLFDTTVSDRVIENLENNPLLHSLNALFHCPLFLALLAITINQNEENPNFTTKTDLFKRFVNCAIKISIDTDNEEFDIFDEKSMSSAGFSEFIKGFSKSLVENLPNKIAVFGNNKFTHEMHRLGLMSCHNEMYTLRERTYYEIFHESLMEFLIAFRLVTEFRSNQFTFHQDFVQHINTNVIERANSSLLLPFLIGLLGDKSSDFFQQMAPFASIYSSQETLLWNMLFESQLKEDTVENFKSFLPSEVHQSEDSSLIPFYCSSKHEELIKLGIEKDRIKNVHHIPNVNMKLPSDVSIPILEVKSNSIDDLQANLNIQKLLGKCENVNSKEEAETIFNFFTSLPSVEKRGLKLTNVNYFNDCQLENIHHLICEFKNNDTVGVEKLISTLQLEENKIEKLQLAMFEQSALKNMENIFNHISHLKFFHFENNTKENCEFDLQSFAPTEEKCLILRNVKLMPTDKQWNLHYLDVDDSNPETATTITSVTTNALSCTTRLLHTLHKIEPTSWPGYQSIQEIVLKVDETALKPHVWHSLQSFQNLKTLIIYLQTRSNKQYWGIDEIQESILSLPVTNFVIWAVQFNIQSVSAFCNKIKEYMLEKNVCNFQNITLFVGNTTGDDLIELRSVFVDLLQCVKSSKLKSLSVCCGNLSMWPLVLRQQVVDMSVFSVEHDLNGSNDDDSLTSKLYFREHLKMYNRFRITLK